MRLDGDRVVLGGQAVTVWEGNLLLDAVQHVRPRATAGFEVIERRQPSLLLDGRVLITGKLDRTTDFQQGMPFHEVFHLTGQAFRTADQADGCGAHPAGTDPHRARPLHRLAGPAPVRRQPGRGLRAQRRRHVVRPGRLSPVEGAGRLGRS